MTNVLTLTTSLSGEQAKSNQLIQAFTEQLRATQAVDVTLRDLATEDLPHLNADEMQAWMTDPAQRSAQQQVLARLSDNLISELESADILLLGMPMYNFGVPSVFKAWIDRVARAGRTFRYTENGPLGLLSGKKAYVFATRGGVYAGTPKDTQSQYIRDVFAFIGITEVEFIYAEGLAMGEDMAREALEQASEKISELIAKGAA